MLNRLPVSIDCAKVIELEGDVDLRTVSGRGEIRSEDAVPERKIYMLVNGVLNIGPDTHKQLAQCVGMTINGALKCPESVYASLSGVMINGSVACYPDGAIVLKRNAVIDGLFALRAKSALYWAERRMIMVDAELDAEALKSKGASFSSKEVIIARSKVEAMLGLIDERAELTIVPGRHRRGVGRHHVGCGRPAPPREAPVRHRRRHRPRKRLRPQRARIPEHPRGRPRA